MSVRPAAGHFIHRIALAQRAGDSTRWEKDIAAYEAQDKASPPAKGQVVFIGSSTIRRWTTLAQDFPEHKTLNRGFGGSQIADATHFADRVVIPYAPRAVFLRAASSSAADGSRRKSIDILSISSSRNTGFATWPSSSSG